MKTVAIDKPVDVYELFDLYVTALQSNFDNTPLTLQGFYQDNQGKMYGNFYYDYLRDKTDNRVTIRVSQDIKAALQNDAFYLLSGYVNRGKINKDSSIAILFHVTKIEKHEKDVQLISEKEYDLIKNRYDTGLFNIESYLQKKLFRYECPRILLVTGNESVVLGDFHDQLGDTEAYKLVIERINLSSQTEIRELLAATSDCDLLAVVRGGGSGLNLFDDPELCRHIIGLNTPFVTAIGHQSDKTLLEKVADKSFATPSAFGAFLKDLARDDYERKTQLHEKERLIESLELEMNTRIGELENVIKKNRTKVVIATMAALILLALYIFYFII